MRINWFDFALPAVLVVGVLRGRKHGMSEELMLVMKWLAIIIVGALSYQFIGDLIAESTAFSHLTGYITAYLSVAAIMTIVFFGLKKALHGKLVGSDVFGSLEYYLGMCAGCVRYACISIFVLAMVNAPLYTDADIKARLAYQNEWYGSDFFPGFQTLQSDIMEKSFTGPYIKEGLSFLLIKSTRGENKGLRRAGPVELPGT